MRKFLVLALAGALLVALAGVAALTIRRNLAASAACDRIEQLERTASDERERRADRGEPVVAFLGDSYTEGQHLASPFDGFPYQAVTDGSVLVSGRGGSGYTPSGPCDGQEFANRIGGVVEAAPDVLVVQGGVNDVASGWDEEDVEKVLDRAAVLDRVIVLGPFTPPSADKEATEKFASFLRDQAEARDLEYVDVDGWVTSWLPDGNHPDEQGAAQIGKRLAPLLR